MRLGSFVTLNFVDSIIAAERISRPRRRQVVSILMIQPTGKAVCLAMSEGSQVDGRLNMSPPQGEIEKYESLYSSAVREAREEITVSISGKVLYLGSIVRQLETDHKRAKDFDEYHYHWVATFADHPNLLPQPPLLSAGWYHFDTLASVSKFSMSEEKGMMFRLALQTLFKHSGDKQLVRKKVVNRPGALLAA